jgi:hypothetical protein
MFEANGTAIRFPSCPHFIFTVITYKKEMNFKPGTVYITYVPKYSSLSIFEQCFTKCILQNISNRNINEGWNQRTWDEGWECSSVVVSLVCTRPWVQSPALTKNNKTKIKKLL